MTRVAQVVLEEALRLSPAEKAELIDRLFRSFDAKVDDEVDAAWAKEAESRIDAYKAGKMPADSMEAVLARINRK